MEDGDQRGRELRNIIVAMAKTRSGRTIDDREFLAAALVGYEQQRSQITERIAEIQRQLGGRPVRAAVPSTNGTAPARRRTMSAAARKRIAEAQRKRWAAYRKEEKPAAGKKTAATQNAAAQPRRRMSAAARKRIAEAQKKRWAAVRAKKGSTAAPKVKTAGA